MEVLARSSMYDQVRILLKILQELIHGRAPLFIFKPCHIYRIALLYVPRIIRSFRFTPWGCDTLVPSQGGFGHRG